MIKTLKHHSFPAFTIEQDAIKAATPFPEIFYDNLRTQVLNTNRMPLYLMLKKALTQSVK